MRSLTITCIVCALVAHVALAAPDPAARIAPLVDEQTLVVARLDLDALDTDALAAACAAVLGSASVAGQAAQAVPMAQMTRDSLRAAGVHELWAAFSMAYAPHAPLVMLAVPADEGTNPAPVGTLLGQPQGGRVVRGMLCMAPEPLLDKLGRLEPEPRPGLAEAFAATVGAPLQVVLTAPDYARRVTEEMLPVLPERLGGGPSAVWTRGVLWASVGIEVAPEARVRIVAQSADAAAARAVPAALQSLLRAMAADPQVQTDAPGLAEVVPLLAPRAVDDRVEITLDQDALAELVGRMLPTPAAPQP